MSVLDPDHHSAHLGILHSLAECMASLEEMHDEIEEQGKPEGLDELYAEIKAKYQTLDESWQVYRPWWEDSPE